MENRLKTQIDFIIEIDKIKHIKRKSRLFDNSRVENDAEHSWHIAVMAMILSEYANDKIDVSKVIKMVLIHDIVEIDAGDVYLYHPDRENAKEKELKAAKRIFSILPEDQKNDYMSIWLEFEERKTAEAKFAAVLDRLEPFLQNYMTKGTTWKEFDIGLNQVLKANSHISSGSEELWAYIKEMLDECVEKKYLKP